MAELPFAFPAIGLLPNAPHYPGETGTREFATPEAFSATHPIFTGGLEGMLIFDSSGQSWQVTAVKVGGAVGNWRERLWRRLSNSPRVAMEYTLVERPPVSFEELRGKLLAQLRKHRSAYSQIGQHFFYADRRAIQASNALSDLVKSQRERELELAPKEPPSAFEQFFGAGRLDRAGLLIFMGAAVALAVGIIELGMRVHPAWFIVALIVLLAAAMSGFARRLRDLEVSPIGLCLVFVWTMPLAFLHDAFKDDQFLIALGYIWGAPLWAGVLWLLCWPGSPGLNRYGPAPGRAVHLRSS